MLFIEVLQHFGGILPLYHQGAQQQNALEPVGGDVYLGYRRVGGGEFEIIA
jgi:hypothetical protein